MVIYRTYVRFIFLGANGPFPGLWRLCGLSVVASALARRAFMRFVLAPSFHLVFTTAGFLWSFVIAGPGRSCLRTVVRFSCLSPLI